MHNHRFVLLLGIIMLTGFLGYTAPWAHAQNESQPFGGQSSYGVFAWELDTELWSNQRPAKSLSLPPVRTYEQKTNPLSWSEKVKNKVKDYLKKPTPATQPTTPTTQACDGTTWTVPTGVQSVKVIIRRANGSIKNTYKITDYISMKSSERVELIPKC